MKRIIIEYKKLNHTLLSLLSEKFPEGYQDNDIITFSNANGDQIQAIEIRTEDTIYLVKVSKKLKEVIHNLKGMGSGFGFPQLTELSAEIEKFRKQDECDPMLKLINEMDSVVDRIEAGIQKAVGI